MSHQPMTDFMKNVNANDGDASALKSSAGLSNVDNTSDANKPISTATQTALDAKQASLGFTPENSANKGAANGYASLDANAKLAAAQLPDAVVGATVYQGAWNASTNSPSLASGTGTQGHYYVVSVAGSTNIDGITDWEVGDWAIFNGTVWEKVDNTEKVSSVAGKTGVVTLDSSDVGLGSVDNTSDADKPISTATQAELDIKMDMFQTVSVTGSTHTAETSTCILADGSSNAITITLPAAADSQYAQLAVKRINSGANDITIDGNASETIDGAATHVLDQQYAAVRLICDGSNWFII